jgi:signal transduction histidine kinase/ActR/RegA family two-component response regulator
MARQPAADDPDDAERAALRARVAALEVELRESEERCRSLLGNGVRKPAEEPRRLLVEGEKMRALGEMASGVAHDLNQYLGLVAGHGELALHELDRPQLDRDSLRDSLRTVVQAAMDGANAVKRLQTFARPRQEGPPEQVDAGELMREVARLTAPRWRDAAQAQGQPIQVEVETAGRPLVAGWAESLREALTNLVFNAVDALPDGGMIRLAAKQSGEWVELAVADSGVGMSAETQARLFEPYFTTKGEHGTGLGLSIVYGIVARHSGQIAVESAPGGGTTFRLLFPLAAAVAPAAPSPAAVAGDCRTLRILAVDDEPALGRLLARLLEMDGHAVVVSSSAEEALGRLAREPFDLVLSDVGMGAGMNGWELAQRVRAAHPGLVFVLATGWGAAIEPEEARRQGIRAVIPKPYRLDDLRRLIASIADGQAKNRSSAPSA